jgi:hypothetical protein
MSVITLAHTERGGTQMRPPRKSPLTGPRKAVPTTATATSGFSIAVSTPCRKAAPPASVAAKTVMIRLRRYEGS